MTPSWVIWCSRPSTAATARTAGSCKDKKEPLVAFRAHWGRTGWSSTRRPVPRAYRGGAFVAFHGSWEPRHRCRRPVTASRSALQTANRSGRTRRRGRFWHRTAPVRSTTWCSGWARTGSLYINERGRHDLAGDLQGAQRAAIAHGQLDLREAPGARSRDQSGPLSRSSGRARLARTLGRLAVGREAMGERGGPASTSSSSSQARPTPRTPIRGPRARAWRPRACCGSCPRSIGVTTDLSEDLVGRSGGARFSD